MKLTRDAIEKVRSIDGYPIAKDEDIISLSRPPYYTACPNPFISDFIRDNGIPYDEQTDTYHCDPFATDVSEGKNDPIYMAHSYHTKVPHRAIMRYILHYTRPGDIVFDGFCGTGMTGVAAQMCGCPDADLRSQIEREMCNDHIVWGARHAILNDLSPAATFIAYNYNSPASTNDFLHTAEKILSDCERDCGWMYETNHVDDKGHAILGMDGKPMKGRINYMVWSDVFVCPSCSGTIEFYSAAYDKKTKKMSDIFVCPNCGSHLSKADCTNLLERDFDVVTGEAFDAIKRKPVLINYFIGKKRYEKVPDEFDLALIERIRSMEIPNWYPTNLMLHKGANWGDSWRAGYHFGVTRVNQFYTKRNLAVLAYFREKCNGDSKQLFWFTSALPKLTIMNRYMPQHGSRALVGPMAGTLYISSLWVENDVIAQLKFQMPKIAKASFEHPMSTIISTHSAVTQSMIPDDSIDYIFTDPPFGSNLNYSELSHFWESWLRVWTNNQDEAIINASQHKGIVEYKNLMLAAFQEMYRILKPNHWITVEFHNSQNAVWNALQEALSESGFIIGYVKVLDKQKGTIQQLTNYNAVKQDLVISAYKPKKSFVREFREKAGSPEMVWEFVRQHLQNEPITVDGNRDGKLDVIAERQSYLLFDRMVAWHIMNGIPVPMDAHTFYDGLRQHFLERDGMYFLPDQVNEYDQKRLYMELDTQQLSFVVSDEKNAIAWLNYILNEGPKTYQQIQPLYLQELHQSKQEKMPELLDMLRENFVQDDKGAWYIPDLTNAADLAKIRRKALLKEFYDSCVPGKGKLKVFRMEAIRAGFDECWKQRDFTTIVSVGERLPESALQEDQTLLMYYDNACSRV